MPRTVNTQMIQCPDGHNITCHKGTNDCTSKAALLCNTEQVNKTSFGRDTIIYCGSDIFHCQAGTQYCYNNSRHYCYTMGSPTIIHCGTNVTKTCNMGSYGCFNNSEMYCAV